jgi:hypothetical protein
MTAALTAKAFGHTTNGQCGGNGAVAHAYAREDATCDTRHATDARQHNTCLREGGGGDGLRVEALEDVGDSAAGLLLKNLRPQN